MAKVINSIIGGGSKIYASIKITGLESTDTVSCSDGYSATWDGTYWWVNRIKELGTYTITASNNIRTVTKSVTISVGTEYDIEMRIPTGISFLTSSAGRGTSYSYTVVEYTGNLIVCVLVHRGTTSVPTVTVSGRNVTLLFNRGASGDRYIQHVYYLVENAYDGNVINVSIASSSYYGVSIYGIGVNTPEVVATSTTNNTADLSWTTSNYSQKMIMFVGHGNNITSSAFNIGTGSITSGTGTITREDYKTYDATGLATYNIDGVTSNITVKFTETAWEHASAIIALN